MTHKVIFPSFLSALKRLAENVKKVSKLFSNPYWVLDGNEIKQSMVPAHVYVAAWQEDKSR